MALKKSFVETANIVTVVSGWGNVASNEKTVTLNDCYIKVESVSGTKIQMRSNVSFESNGAKKTHFYTFQPSLTGKNFIAQTYEYLKTLPEFSDAIDC
jgi:hypothetical protein